MTDHRKAALDSLPMLEETPALTAIVHALLAIEERLANIDSGLDERLAEIEGAIHFVSGRSTP